MNMNNFKIMPSIHAEQHPLDSYYDKLNCPVDWQIANDTMKMISVAGTRSQLLEQLAEWQHRKMFFDKYWNEDGHELYRAMVDAIIGLIKAALKLREERKYKD